MGVVTGKTNTKRFVAYDIAMQIVRSNNITSRARYWKWWDENKPDYMPKYPYRVFAEWEGWNAFLGGDNSFEKELNRRRMITRPYWEAVRWVQAQGYNTQYEYKDAYEAGDVPTDIPKQPNDFYDEWQGWGVWLGKDVRSYIMSKSENLNMMALCRIRNQAGNLIEIVYNEHGVAALQKAIGERDDLTPYKVYHVDQEEQKVVTNVLQSVASPQGGNVYLCPNINELHFELDNLLQQYVPTTR